MTRNRPENRIADLVDGSTRIFIRRGYRQTRMADVARELGIAKGTLYLYVAGKEALFDAVVRYADRRDDALLPAKLPTPKPGATVRFIRNRLAGEVERLTIVSAPAATKTRAPSQNIGTTQRPCGQSYVNFTVDVPAGTSTD